MERIIKILSRLLVALKKDWFLPLLKITVKIFFAITIIVIVLQIFEFSKYPILFNSEGINNFLNYYSISIKFFTALFALIVIWVTLERLSQTDKRLLQAEKQMDLISDNNRFNNFIVHKKEFNEFFGNKEYIENFEKDEKTSSDNILSLLYGAIYYDSYKDFVPNVNHQFNQQIDKISNEIEKLYEIVLSDDQFQDLTIKIIKIKIKINIHLKSLVSSWDQPNTAVMQIYGETKYRISGADLNQYIRFISGLKDLYCIIRIYEDIKLFEGRPSLLAPRFVNEYITLYRKMVSGIA